MSKEREEQLRGNIWKNPKQEPAVAIQHDRGGPGSVSSLMKGEVRIRVRNQPDSHFRGAGEVLGPDLPAKLCLSLMSLAGTFNPSMQ